MDRRILRYAKKNTWLYILTLTALVGQIVMRVVAPTLLAKIIDEVIGGGDLGVFPYLLTEMFIAYFSVGLLGYVQELSADMVSRRTVNTLREDVFEAVSRQDGVFFAERTPADLMTRTNNDTDSIGFLYGFCGVFLLQIIATVISQFIALMRVNLYAAIVPTLCLPIIGFMAFRSEVKGDKISDAISDKRADLNQATSEAITGIRTVKSFGKEEKEKARFGKEASLFRDITRKFDCHWVNWGTPQSVIAMCMTPLVILVCGFQLIDGRMTMGQLAMAVEYIGELSWPVMEIGWLFIEISSARAGWKKVKAILDRKPSIDNGTRDDVESRGTIRFENVSFRKGERTLLEDVSFEITPGKTVAIMGPSGSGKSLIASLAVRLTDPTEGRVTINGVDMRDMTLSTARSFSSIVTQDVFLFSDTVKNNIALGRRGLVSDEEIRRAATDAEATAFIEKLENGWDTVIGERGVGLSGGQKQRLSIARAFVRDNQLLILDDATSALDMETERDIERTIREEGSRSLLIAAHRISAVAGADEILVLEDGRIMERGTHQELLKRKGLYWKTYISQYPEEEERA